jgi:predicted transcriptional regulator
MTIHDIEQTLTCEVLYPRKNDTEEKLRSIIACDLMSDVLIIDQEVDLLITSLSTTQALRAANIVSAKAVVIVNGKPISPDMILAAQEFDIALLRTKCSTFETCGLIHRAKEKH